MGQVHSRGADNCPVIASGVGSGAEVPVAAAVARPRRGAGNPLRARVGALAAGWGLELGWLGGIGFAMPIVIAWHYGSLSAPVSDDWAYDLSAYHLAFHGGIDLYGWGTINLIGQLFLAVPVLWVFGAHIWVLNVWTCVLGVIGLIAVDHLGRALGLPRRQALFVAVLVGAGPMWAVLSTSFMTDIPSFAVMTVALAVAAGDRRTDRIVTSRTVVALALAALAFTIREPAGVAFGAIAICRLYRAGRPALPAASRWVAVVGVLGAVLVGFYLWRRALPSGSIEQRADWSYLWLGTWWYGKWLFPLLGLVLAPVVGLIGPRRMIRRAWGARRTELVLAWLIMPIGPVVLYLAFGPRGGEPARSGLAGLVEARTPSFGNSFFDFSGLPDPGVGHPFVPDALVWALAVIAVGSTLVVVAAIVAGLDRWATRPRLPRRAPSQSHHVAVLLAIVAVGSFLVWGVLIGSERIMWDRYLLPGVMAAALVLLYLARQVRGDARVPARAWWQGTAALVGMAVLSLVVTIADDGYTGSQWRYSDHFAAASAPGSLIATDWTWSSMQRHEMTALIPGYAPCYIETVDGPTAPNALDRLDAGSWVEHYTFSMSMSTAPSAGVARCRSAPRRPPQGHR
jgi:hypothetical protein